MNGTAEINRTFDVIIVGNGALGQSLGLTLARQGVRVAIVGSPHRPWAASAAAGAMLGCFGEVTSTLVDNEYGRAKLDLDVRAGKLWPEWSAELAAESGDENVRTADGTIVMLNTIGVSGIDDVNYTAIREELVRYGEPFEDIEPEQVDWLDPDSSSRPLKAVYIPGEHAVDAARLLDQLDVAFLRAGGTVIPEPAERVAYRRGTVDGVVLASGTKLAAGHVVLAAGACTQHLLDTVPDVAASVPRLVSGYGVSALVRTEDGTNPSSVIRTPNRAFACGLHVVPRSSGQVYVGATNVISADPVDTPVIRDLHFLLDCANRQVRRNLYASDLVKVQVGNRPVALDGFPLLGPTGLSGLWMMTGTYRDGLHLSPLLARELANQILGIPSEISFDTFRPVRQPIQPVNREKIVETAVLHRLATGYELDWTVQAPWPPFIETQLRRVFSELADDIDDDYTPPPDLLDAARVDPSLLKILREYYAVCRTTA